MKGEINKIKFVKYNGIEGYIELMKHDVEPLNNPDCKSIELYYDGKDIKAVLDYITNLQEENERLKKALCKDNIVSKCKYDYLKRQKEGLELDLFCIKDYKSRIEKAVDYIEKSINNPQPFYEYIYGDEDGKTQNLDKLLNILQGVDKDER